MTLPLVLLPGMMCDARLFGPQIDAFSAARVVQVAPIGGHDSVAALAREVLLHAPPVFALLGLSMGGIVAMECLRRLNSDPPCRFNIDPGRIVAF